MTRPPGAWRGWTLTSTPRWKTRTSSRSARTSTRAPIRFPGIEYRASADLDVMVAVHLGGGVDGQVVAAGRGGQQPGFLLQIEQLDRPAGVRAVHPPARPAPRTTRPPGAGRRPGR